MWEWGVLDFGRGFEFWTKKHLSLSEKSGRAASCKPTSHLVRMYHNMQVLLDAQQMKKTFQGEILAESLGIQDRYAFNKS